MKAQKLLLWLNAGLGAVLALTPFILFPVCAELRPDGTPMKCWYSGIFITVMGVLTVGFSLMALWGKLPAVFALLSAAAALMCWLVPNGIVTIAGETWACGLCADPNHACRAVTSPALAVIVPLAVLVSVFFLVLRFVQPDANKKRTR